MTATTSAVDRAATGHAQDTSGLHVRAADIEFSNARPDLVNVSITVRNDGRERSPPTFGKISAAPLGAFVPWQLLAVAGIPSLGPNEAHVVRIDTREKSPLKIGSADRVPPSRVLVALAEDDENRLPRRPVVAPPSAGASSVTVGGLPTDLLKLLGQGSTHFAGNLNIFIGARAVERHMAKALRVYPGQTNLAMFIVGSGRDAYAFDLQGPAAKWNATLYNMTRSDSFVPIGGQGKVALRRWVEQASFSMMVLAISPPKHCEQGAVEVHVKQRSTGETAVVEFSLDPNAAGPGCYAV